MESKVEKKSFADFDVYSFEGNHSLIHVDINSGDDFYKKIFEHFFSEDRLLQYIENKSYIKFTPTPKNYVELYKNLRLFIDSEYVQSVEGGISEDIISILQEEGSIIHSDGELAVRLDKIGKIGEYIFSNILSEYFQFSCIIPKLRMVTNNNMSIFGIDTLFYAPDKKMLLFGESKMSSSLSNGIKLINKSLKCYRKQIDEEFFLILSNRWHRHGSKQFDIDFGEIIDTTISMQEFIEIAKISTIAVPIFIGHGSEVNEIDILKKMLQIDKINLYGLDTIFISISLPIVDKSKLVNSFTRFIYDKMSIYNENRKI